jgi:hypothetical protein
MFKPGTMLYPRQRLGLRITNLTDQDQVIGFCVMGYLEVR